MRVYNKFMGAYEEHLIWCLANNGQYTQEEWDTKKSINFYEIMNKYNLEIKDIGIQSYLNG